MSYRLRLRGALPRPFPLTWVSVEEAVLQDLDEVGLSGTLRDDARLQPSRHQLVLAADLGTCRCASHDADIVGVHLAQQVYLTG